jgi:hypothetical protein
VPRSGFQVLRTSPAAARVLAIAAVTRLHVGGLGLAVLLLVEHERGSLAAAGLVTAALSLGVGTTRPVQGRLVDRAGARILAPVAAAHAGAGAALLAACGLDAAGPWLAAAAFLLGFTAPAVSVVTRSTWVASVPPAGRPAVFGLDTALENAAFALGPVLAGAIAVVASAGAAVAALLVVGCGGGVAIARTARLPARRADPPPSLARLRPIGRPLVTSVGHGVVYGSVGVAAVATVLDAGQPWLAGPLSGALFAGGLAGDLLIAPRRPDVPLAARLRIRCGVLLLAVALLPAVPGELLGAALLVTGACLAAAAVTVLLDVGARAAADTRAEAFGWAGAALRLGNAIGAGAAGVVAEAASGRAALLVAAGGAALAVLAVSHGAARATRGSRPRRLSLSALVR